MSADPSQSPVERAVAQGCRRISLQLALREVLSVIALFLAAIVLRLYFPLQFPALLVWLFLFAGIATAIYEWRRARPRPYEVAQQLDASYRSADQISTAYFFDRADPSDSPAKALVRKRASDAAERGDLAAAFPFEIPRIAYVALGLAVITGVLIANPRQIRVAIQQQPPQSADQTQLNEEQPAEEIEDIEPERPEDVAQPLDRQGQTEDGQDPIIPETETAEEAPIEPFEMPEVEGLSTGEETGDEIASAEQQEGEGGQEAGDQSETVDENATEQAENEPGGDWDEKSQNLLDRLQDAFRNMMENMGVDPPQAAENQPQSSSEGEGSEESAEGGEQTEAEADAAGGQPSDAEMEGGEPTETASEASAEGSGGEDSDEAAPNGQMASASGSGEGDKELAAEAETQAAMDALEEFYMQRAEDLTGEIMVETTSAEQDARMPFQPTATQHADRGGAITRDEVPLAYQRFVQQYFEKLRANEQ